MDNLVTFITDSNEQIVVRYDRETEFKQEHREYYIIGSKFVTIINRSWTALHIEKCDIESSNNCFTVALVAVKTPKTTIKLPDNTFLYIFCANRISTVTEDERQPLLIVVENDYKEINVISYIDILFATKLDLDTIIHNDVELLCYGTYSISSTSTTTNSRSQFATRLLIPFKQFRQHMFTKHDEFLITLSVRSSVEFELPGSLVPFVKDDQLVLFFQFCCIRNTNKSMKRTLTRSLEFEFESISENDNDQQQMRMKKNKDS